MTTPRMNIRARTRTHTHAHTRTYIHTQVPPVREYECMAAARIKVAHMTGARLSSMPPYQPSAY